MVVTDYVLVISCYLLGCFRGISWHIMGFTCVDSDIAIATSWSRIRSLSAIFVHQLLVDVIHVASCQFQRVGAVTDLRHGSVLLGVRIICAQLVELTIACVPGTTLCGYLGT